MSDYVFLGINHGTYVFEAKQGFERLYINCTNESDTPELLDGDRVILKDGYGQRAIRSIERQNVVEYLS